jgi:hypothetical protein
MLKYRYKHSNKAHQVKLLPAQHLVMSVTNLVRMDSALNVRSDMSTKMDFVKLLAILVRIGTRIQDFVQSVM